MCRKATAVFSFSFPATVCHLSLSDDLIAARVIDTEHGEQCRGDQPSSGSTATVVLSAAPHAVGSKSSQLCFLFFNGMRVRGSTACSLGQEQPS